jgi:hypothetical protein
MNRRSRRQRRSFRTTKKTNREKEDVREGGGGGGMEEPYDLSEYSKTVDYMLEKTARCLVSLKMNIFIW